MYISNKDIRARARYLLDDNIFGKDWLKSVLFIVFYVLISGVIGNFLSEIVSTIMSPLPQFLINIGVEHEIFYIFAVVMIIYIAVLSSAVATGPFMYSLSAVHLDFVREEGGFHISKIFCGFKNFVANVQLAVMRTIHIFLWSLLFIVPGIYVMYSYRMIYHVKHDNPEFSWKDCFDESERLMDGNRWRLFKLDFSFIGWYLLCILTLGIGTFFLLPYINAATAEFYTELKSKQLS